MFRTYKGHRMPSFYHHSQFCHYHHGLQVRPSEQHFACHCGSGRSFLCGRRYPCSTQRGSPVTIHQQCRVACRRCTPKGPHQPGWCCLGCHSGSCDPHGLRSCLISLFCGQGNVTSVTGTFTIPHIKNSYGKVTILVAIDGCNCTNSGFSVGVTLKSNGRGNVTSSGERRQTFTPN